MKAFGGKILITLFLVCLYSCDIPKPLCINNQGRDFMINSDCGSVIFNGSIFGGSLLIFTQKFNGNFEVLIDSLNHQFYPNTIKVESVDYYLNGNQIKNSIINIQAGQTLSMYYKLYAEVPTTTDTVLFMVVPSQFILCNGKPLLTDTIRIRLK
jgi:hypothetical protein